MYNPLKATNHECPICVTCPNNFECEDDCELANFEPANSCYHKSHMLLSMAVSHDKTLDELRILGILDLISNGFILCLDGTGASETDSALHIKLDGTYYCNANQSISLSKEEVYGSVVTYIRPSNTWKNTTIIYLKPKEEN